MLLIDDNIIIKNAYTILLFTGCPLYDIWIKYLYNILVDY